MQYLTRTDNKEASNKEEDSLSNIDMSEDNSGVKATFPEPHNKDGMKNKNRKCEILKNGDNCMIAGGICTTHDIGERDIAKEEKCGEQGR